MVHRTTIAQRMCLTALMVCSLGFALPTESDAAAGDVSLAMLPQIWRDDDGRLLTLAQLSGRYVVLTMAYAHCHRICPMTIAGLKELQATLDARGSVAEFVIVGYDPANEGPAAWRQYRRSHHLDRPTWHFVTGSVADTAQLARQLQFELWKYDEHVMHDSRVLVFDAQGLLSRALGPGADFASVTP